MILQFGQRGEGKSLFHVILAGAALLGLKDPSGVTYVSDASAGAVGTVGG